MTDERNDETTAPDEDTTPGSPTDVSAEGSSERLDGTTETDSPADRVEASDPSEADSEATDSTDSETGAPPPSDPPPPEQAPTTSGETLPPPPRTELVRTNGRRVFAGVGSGIGDYLDISPWIPRLAFIFLTPFGGFGLLIYLAGWLLIRREDEAESIGERLWGRMSTGQNWLGALLVFIAALIVIASFDFLRPGLVFAVGLLIVGVLLYRGNIGGPAAPGPAPPPLKDPEESDDMTTTSLSSPPVEGTPPRPPRAQRPVVARPPRPRRAPSPLGRWTVGVALLVVGTMAALDIAGAAEPFPRHYAAALLGVVGLGLLVGTFAGRARWLIFPGLLLLPMVVGASFIDIPFDGNFEVRTVTITPDTPGDVLDRYEFEAGEFTLDLSEIDFTTAESISVDMGAGQLRVVLPDDLAADVEVRVGVGDIGGVVGNSDGIGLVRQADLEGSQGPLELDIELGAGEVDVVRGG